MLPLTVCSAPQDVLVCAWEEEGLPCEYAVDLYWLNKNHFRLIASSDGTKDVYAKLNDPLP